MALLLLFLGLVHSQARDTSAWKGHEREVSKIIEDFDLNLCEQSKDSNKPPGSSGHLERHQSDPTHGDVCRSSVGGYYCPFVNRTRGTGKKFCHHHFEKPYCMLEKLDTSNPCRVPAASDEHINKELIAVKAANLKRSVLRRAKRRGGHQERDNGAKEETDEPVPPTSFQALPSRVAGAVADHAPQQGVIEKIVGGAIEQLTEGKAAPLAERKGDISRGRAAEKRRSWIS